MPSVGAVLTVVLLGLAVLLECEILVAYDRVCDAD